MSKTETHLQKPPAVIETGLGYQSVRSRWNGEDNTAYIHQLCAIVKNDLPGDLDDPAAWRDPHEVFSDAYDTDHRPLSAWLDLKEPAPPTPVELGGQVAVPAIDTPEGVELRGRWEHRRANLEHGDE